MGQTMNLDELSKKRLAAAHISAGRQWLLSAAAIVIVLAGLRAASDIITPFLLAAFLAIICAPPLSSMQKKGVPGALAVLVLFTGVGLAFFLLFIALKGAVESMATQAPLYNARLSALLNSLREALEARGLPGDVIPATLPIPNFGSLSGAAGAIASGVGSFTASALLVLLAFMFLLMEERHLPDKLQLAFPGRRRGRVRLRRFLRSVYQYLLIKTLASSMTGLLVGIGLSLIGVDFAILWGIVAGLLNFVPTIGSIIAAIPPLLIALLSLELPQVLLVLLLMVSVNVTIGNILEPRFTGTSLGLSPLVVMVSLLVWGWVFGPVGMLLSVPLTMVAKLALESNRDTRWLGVLMSDRVKKPRALVRRA